MRQPGRSEKRAQDVPGNNGSINARDLEMDQWLLYCSSGALPVVGIPIISPDLACRAMRHLSAFIFSDARSAFQPGASQKHWVLFFVFVLRPFRWVLFFVFGLAAHFSFLLTH